MAWDIYGNPLERGHCEVHPHVHEEYPCCVCMSERGQTQQPHDALQQLQYEFAQQGDYIKQLEAERDALAAQLVSIQDAALKPRGRTRQQWIDNIKRCALEVSARECLRDIQAEAVIDAVNFGRSQTKYFLRDSEDILQQLEQYAAKVRKGGAG